MGGGKAKNKFGWDLDLRYCALRKVTAAKTVFVRFFGEGRQRKK